MNGSTGRAPALLPRAAPPGASQSGGRLAGAQRPAPSRASGQTPPRGRARPDPLPGRACTRLLRFLPALALLLGAFSFFPAAPAHAQDAIWSATLAVDVAGAFSGCANTDPDQAGRVPGSYPRCIITERGVGYRIPAPLEREP